MHFHRNMQTKKIPGNCAPLSLSTSSIRIYIEYQIEIFPNHELGISYRRKFTIGALQNGVSHSLHRPFVFFFCFFVYMYKDQLSYSLFLSVNRAIKMSQKHTLSVGPSAQFNKRPISICLSCESGL